MKKVLGISAHYHDSSAALVIDGKVVAQGAEERFTLQKHDSNFPKYAIEFCLQRAGITAQELDAIVFYEEPHTKFSRVFASTMANYPHSRGAFVKSMESWITGKLWIKNDISKRLDVHPDRIHFAPHHLSHAAQAFSACPFEDAGVLVIDAVGEWGSTSLYHGSFKNGHQLDALDVIPYPHSLGLVYAAFTGFIGFKVNDGECSTMALATFGKPVYADKIRKIIQIQEDGTYKIDASYFAFEQFGSLPYSEKFLAEFGQPRSFKDALPFDCLAEGGASEPVSKEQQYYADIAASIQLVLEEAIMALCRRLQRATGSKNLCFAGGVALNCVANAKLMKEGIFENMFIPPDPGDGGAAMGAALYGYYAMGGTRPQNYNITPYLGNSHDAAQDIEMLEHLDPDNWIRHREIGTHQNKGMKLEVTKFENFDALVDKITSDLKGGKIVGWYQDRFENGPRALGNRSILIDPANIPLALKLSKHVKARAAYRPYALSIAEEHAHDVLELPNKIPGTARWMQTVAKIKQERKERVAAAGHVDGTTRPQVCSKTDNPRYHALLTAYGKKSGISALLNTSFNDSGLPIVNTPAEALIMFARTDMDLLVLNDYVVRKVA